MDDKQTPTYETASKAEETIDLKEQYRSLLDRIDALEQRRVSQASIPPQTVKSRHLEEGIELNNPNISTIINNGTLTLPSTTGTIALLSDISTVTPGTSGSIMMSNGTIWTSVFPVRARATPNGAQTITSGSNDEAVFDVETFDDGNNFASNKFTAPVTGLYLVSANIFWANSGNAGRVYSHLKRDSSAVCQYETYRAANYGSLVVIDQIKLTSGQTCNLTIGNETGANLVTNQIYCHFEISLLSIG
jgi:hypothetical protein